MFQIKIHLLILSPQTFGSRNKKQVGAYVQKGQLVIFVNSSFYRSKSPYKIRSNNGGVSYLELNEPCMVRFKLNKFKHVWGGARLGMRVVPCMVRAGEDAGAGGRVLETGSPCDLRLSKEGIMG